MLFPTFSYSTLSRCIWLYSFAWIKSIRILTPATGVIEHFNTHREPCFNANLTEAQRWFLLTLFFVISQTTQRHTPVAQVCFHQIVIPFPFSAFTGLWHKAQPAVSANWFHTIQTGNVMKGSRETVFTNSGRSFSRRPSNEKHNPTYITEREND